MSINYIFLSSSFVNFSIRFGGLIYRCTAFSFLCVVWWFDGDLGCFLLVQLPALILVLRCTSPEFAMFVENVLCVRLCFTCSCSGLCMLCLSYAIVHRTTRRGSFFWFFQLGNSFLLFVLVSANFVSSAGLIFGWLCGVFSLFSLRCCWVWFCYVGVCWLVFYRCRTRFIAPFWCFLVGVLFRLAILLICNHICLFRAVM